MRDSLTALAAVVVLALFGALIGPRFVDWDSRRADIAARISAVLGVPVRIDGTISVALLPSPVIRLGLVHLGEGDTRATIRHIAAEAALPPLFKGELRLTNLHIDGAEVNVIAPDQPRVLSAPALDRFATIGIGKLTLTDSRLSLLPRDDTAPTILDGITGEAEAGTLLGPWRGNVAFKTGIDHLILRFSTVRPEGTAMRVRIVAESDTRSLRAEYDGRIDLATGVPVLDGTVTANGQVPVPLRDGPSQTLWRMQGKLKGERTGVVVDELQISFGAPERQVTFTGVADVQLTTRLDIKATLSTQQVDIDRAVTAENQPPASPQITLGRIQGSADGAALPLSLKLDLSAGRMMLGGDVIGAPRAVAEWSEGGFVLHRLEAELPGRSILSFIAPPKSAREGQLAFSSRAPQRLLQWYTGRTGPVPPVGTLEINGGATWTGGRIAMRDATLKLDAASLAGDIDLDTTSPVPRLTAILKGTGLDLAKLPPVQSNGGAIETDLTLDLEKVSFAGRGAGQVRARLWQKADALTIEALDITNLGGANLTLKGSISADKRDIAGRLEGVELEAMVNLVSRLVPHPIVTTVGERLKSHAPVSLAIASDTDRDTGDERFTLRGRLGAKNSGLDVAASLRLDRTGNLSGREGLSISLDGATVEPMARLIGLEAIGVTGAPASRLAFTAAGPDQGKDGPFTLSASLAGTQIEAAGRWNGAEWTAGGRFSLVTNDLSPLAQSLLIAVPAVPPGFSLSATADLDVRNLRITLANLNATATGQPVSGEIAFNLREFGRVSGQIRTGQVDATAIAPLIFGAGSAPLAPTGWSNQPFGPVAAITLPGDLYIEADAAQIGEATSIARPRFVLRFETGLVYLEHARGEWQGGMLEGRATLRRADKLVAVSGDMTLVSADAGQVFGEPRLSGRMSASLELSGSGSSTAALMGSLAGTGTVTGHDVVVPRIRPGLLQALLSDALREGAEISSPALANRAEQKLGGGLALATEAVPLSIAAGTMRLGPMAVPSGEEHIDAGLLIDIPRRALTGQATFTARQNPPGWTGPPPRLGVAWRRENGDWRHAFDTAALSSGLMTIAVEREQERIDMLEQDQRERASFNRRLRASEQERRPAGTTPVLPRF